MGLEPLQRSFFSRSTDTVAKDLLGKYLVVHDLVGQIVETEAYFGPEDPASHASRNLKRAKIMWDTPGLAYVYNCHKYWMLNVVAHDNHVGAVLIRGVVPIKGTQKILSRVKDTLGPGKLCMGFGITKEYNGIDLTKPPVYLADGPSFDSYEVSKRIGVKDESLMRFYIPKKKIKELFKN